MEHSQKDSKLPALDTLVRIVYEGGSNDDVRMSRELARVWHNKLLTAMGTREIVELHDEMINLTIRAETINRIVVVDLTVNDEREKHNLSRTPIGNMARG